MQLETQSHVPDVLFVDEDGNPIEPGHENVVYVDENGSEIPEEVAVQLLESGKYVDSREFYNDGQSRFNSLSKSSIGGGLSRLASSQALYQAQAAAQAKAQAQMHAQMQAMSLAEAQAQVFAKAQADLKQREEELASIEADATRGDTPISIKQKQTNSVKSISASELQIQKSQSGRRLLQPPAKKIETKSSENIERASTKQSLREEYEEDLDQQEQVQRITELKEHELLKERLLQKQREIMEQQFQQRLSRQSEQYEQQLHQHKLQQHQQRQQLIESRRTTQSIVSQNEQNEQAQFEASLSSAALVVAEQLNETARTEETLNDTRLSATPISLNVATKDKLKEFKEDFQVGQVRLIGYLTGNKVVRNVNQLSPEDIDRLYEEAMRDQTPTPEDKDDGLDQSLFNDEIVEIDFGPIDAYTAALNAHINAQKNSSEVDDDQRFPAHVLTCSHATFIDNQLMLGEPMYNTFDSNNVINGTSGVNVELYQPDDDGNQGNGSYGTFNKNTFSRTNTQVEYENGQYSRSQSFGSMVDIQSQNGYSLGELNQNNENYQESNYYSNLNTESQQVNQNLDAYLDSYARGKQNTSGFYANTQSISNNYVSR